MKELTPEERGYIRRAMKASLRQTVLLLGAAKKNLPEADLSALEEAQALESSIVAKLSDEPEPLVYGGAR